MNKRKSLLVLLAISIISCGCRSGQDSHRAKKVDLSGFDYEHDAQYMFMGDVNEQFVARCGDGYYIRVADVLYFADPKLETVVPVCYRLDCLHARETTIQDRCECGGYLGTSISVGGGAISYADGTLYTSSGFDIVNREPLWMDLICRTFAISPDGMEKRQVQGLPPGLETYTVVHRGYYYYTYVENEAIADGMTDQVHRIARMPVGGGKEEVLLETRENSLDAIVPYREFVYFRKPLENGTSVQCVYLTETGEVKEIHHRLEYRFGFTCRIEGDHLLWFGAPYFGTEDEAGTCETVWRSELDGSNMKKILDLGDLDDQDGTLEKWDLRHTSVATDGTWLYFNNYWDNYWEEDKTDQQHIIRYYDRNTLEYGGSILIEEGNEYSYVSYGDDRYLFFMRKLEDERSQICYVKKDEMKDGSPQVHVLVEGSDYDHGWVSYD